MYQNTKVNTIKSMDNLSEFYEARKSVATFMARLYNTRLTTTTGGNISVRAGKYFFCITPSGIDKANLTPEMIAVVSFDGVNLTPHLKLSMESEMHRLILEQNPNVNAVVHAHPVFASMFTASKPDSLTIDTRLTAEAWYVLGQPAFAPYQKMGTKQLAAEVAYHARQNSVVLMQNHGILATGDSLVQAFDKIEILENAAKMTVFSKLLERSGFDFNELTDEQCNELVPGSR